VSRGKQKSSHRGSQAHTDSADIRPDVPHCVKDCHSCSQIIPPSISGKPTTRKHYTTAAAKGTRFSRTGFKRSTTRMKPIYCNSRRCQGLYANFPRRCSQSPHKTLCASRTSQCQMASVPLPVAPHHCPGKAALRTLTSRPSSSTTVFWHHTTSTPPSETGPWVPA
jgi:hypothetical protein